MTQKKNTALGVVVGRFQVATLHEGHRALLDEVARQHEHLLVVLGCTNIRRTPKDPLSFEDRRTMILDQYPFAQVVALKDSPVSTAVWSKELDQLIEKAIEKHATDSTAVLYGSRDSFIPRYSGKFQCEELPKYRNINGTEVRSACAEGQGNSVEYRRGCIATIAKQYPVTDPTVDVAILTEDRSQVLLGKRGEDSAHWRFIGGFVDPKDASSEHAAFREAHEEVTGVELSDPRYIGSARICDPRYQNTSYGVMTTFFEMLCLSGEPVAADDMGIVAWHVIDEGLYGLITPEHRCLVDVLLRGIETNNYRAA